MAKGFTVKAKNPKKNIPSKPEWDYNLARGLVKGKTIVFCLPGRGVSYNFLKSFVTLAFDLVQAGAAIQISQDYSSMVNFARCKCLGANVLRGPNQLPWDGKLKYDYQLWIDSDIVFNTEKFYQLILNAIPENAVTKEEVYEPMKNEKGEVMKNPDGSEAKKLAGFKLIVDPEKERQICAGWYCTEDGKTTSVAHWLDEDDFRTIGLLQRCRYLNQEKFKICAVRTFHSVLMQKKQDLKSGVTLVFELDTKKQGLFKV